MSEKLLCHEGHPPLACPQFYITSPLIGSFNTLAEQSISRSSERSYTSLIEAIEQSTSHKKQAKSERGHLFMESSNEAVP